MKTPETHRYVQETIDTYNQSAEALAEYFRGIGPRIDDIDRAFTLAGNPEHAKVVEIGCGDGRDANEIVPRTGWYLGFDVSDAMINLAEKQVPQGTFEVADVTTFQFPPDLDIIFAFASLLHTKKEDLKGVFGRVYTALKPGGIFYISLKHAPEYHEEIKEDSFGTRLFYFYNPETIQALSSQAFRRVHLQQEKIGNTEWFEVAYQKPRNTRQLL